MTGSSKSTDRTRIAEVKQESGCLLLRWGDGHDSRFAYVWLRHALFFPAFGDEAVGKQDYRTPQPSSRTPPIEAGISETGHLRVRWSNEAEASEYDPVWLRDRCPSPSERARRRRPSVTWDAALGAAPPEMNFAAAATDDGGRLALIEQVLDYGICFVRDLPPEPGQVAVLGKLFGTVRLSAYGDEPGDGRIENVRADPKVSVSTRRAYFLGPHTDTCWRSAVSGLVILHCLVAQEAGGETLLVDGFAAAERLRARDPEAFGLLSSTKLNFRASVANGDEWRALGQIITCDAEGAVVGFRYCDRNLGPLDLPEEMIEPAYAALASLEIVLYDPALWIRCRLAPGDAVVVDNQRVLHGRTAFDPAAGPRHLQHCSIERDTFHHTYRRLARALDRPDWDQVLSYGVC